METREDVRLRALKADISARLRPVCADWPAERFDSMVERLASITLRYISSPVGSYDRRATDRLVQELKETLERSEAARAGLEPKPQSRPRRPRRKNG